MRHLFRIRGNRAGTATVSLTERHSEATVHGCLGNALNRRRIPGIVKRLNEKAPEVLQKIAALELKKDAALKRAKALLDAIENGGGQAVVERHQQGVAEAAQLEYQIAGLRRQDIEGEAAEKLLLLLSHDVRRVLEWTSREGREAPHDR